MFTRLFRLAVLSRIAVVALVMLTAWSSHGPASVAHASGPVNWTYKGFTIASWGTNDLYNAGPALQQLASEGANTVTFVVTWYTDNLSSTNVYATGSTSSDAALEWAIQQAHTDGLKVMLKPHLDAASGGWRANINPTDYRTWFNNYDAMIEHYADIAQQYHVELLCIGAELIDMSTNSSYTPYWNALISNIRGRYSGKLTYSANWGSGSFATEFNRIPFWNNLDYIGISAYFPVSDTSACSVSDANAHWASWQSNTIQPYQQQIGKPVLFTEIGYRSGTGTCNQPFDDWDTWPVDWAQQQTAYEAMFESWNNVPYFAGAMFWLCDINTNLDPNNTAYQIQNKPAMTTVSQWFGGSTATATSTSTATPATSTSTATPASSTSTPTVSPASTPTVAPTPTPTTGQGAYAFDFEDGTTQGWYTQWGSEQAVNSTASAFSGTHSLGVTMTGSGYPGISVSSGLAGVKSGTQITYHVYVSHPGIGVTPYACDGNWTTHSAQGFALSAGWSTIAWTVPQMSGLNCIGFQISDSNGWTGEVDLDAVSLGATAPAPTSTPTNTPVPATSTATPTNTPVPPTATVTPTNTPVPPTATATNTPVAATATPIATPVSATVTPTTTSSPYRFDFEDGTTQGWQIHWGTQASLSNTTAVAYSGTHALGITISGAGYPGIATSSNLSGLTTGSVVTYHIYAPAGARLGASTFACDGNWTTHNAGGGVSLSQGWNAVSWTIPQMNGLNCIGLQVNDSSGWTGQIELDAVR